MACRVRQRQHIVRGLLRVGAIGPDGFCVYQSGSHQCIGDLRSAFFLACHDFVCRFNSLRAQLQHKTQTFRVVVKRPWAKTVGGNHFFQQWFENVEEFVNLRICCYRGRQGCGEQSFCQVQASLTALFWYRLAKPHRHQRHGGCWNANSPEPIGCVHCDESYHHLKDISHGRFPARCWKFIQPKQHPLPITAQWCFDLSAKACAIFGHPWNQPVWNPSLQVAV